MFQWIKRMREPVEVLWYCRHCSFVKRDCSGKIPNNFESFIGASLGVVSYYHKECGFNVTRWKQL